MRTALPLLLSFLIPATAAAQERCSVGVLHYNIQYVAGGLEGMAEDLGIDSGDYDWSEEAMEDAIIRESFLPLLDTLDRHPDWTLTFEMQALMVEIMAERFPDELDRLRLLADEGRAELASFHYSDQLFLAYPQEDMARSIERTIATFELLDLPLSGVVFTQEGQFGEGMIPLMQEYGYTVAVLPRNLFKLHHEDDTTRAFFERDGTTVMVGGRSFDDADSGAGASWYFLDDGELVATNDLPPYLGPLFVYQEESLLAFEDKLQEKVDQGYRIAGVEDCVQSLLDEGVERDELPPILDGAWQPGDTDNLGLWMGGGGTWSGDDGTERDNRVLTTGTRGHKTLAAVGAHLDDESALDEAWRELLLGQVSDSTGWNPYRTETEYSLEHMGRAIELAADALVAAHPDRAGQVLWLDGDGTILEGDPADAIGEGPFGASHEASAGERAISEEHLVSGTTGLPVLAITFGEGSHQGGSPQVAFDWDGEAYRLVTALTHDVRQVAADELTCETNGQPASLGVVGLAPDTWLVLDQQSVHLAARYDRGQGTVTFLDETLGPDESATWRFHLAASADEALAAGIRLNESGPVAIELPAIEGDDDDDSAADDDDDDGGCACDQGAPEAGGLALVLSLGGAWFGRRVRNPRSARS